MNRRTKGEKSTPLTGFTTLLIGLKRGSTIASIYQ